MTLREALNEFDNSLTALDEINERLESDVKAMYPRLEETKDE